MSAKELRRQKRQEKRKEEGMIETVKKARDKVDDANKYLDWADTLRLNAMNQITEAEDELHRAEEVYFEHFGKTLTFSSDEEDEEEQEAESSPEKESE